MAKYGSRNSAVLTPQYPAEQANPNSKHWKEHTNCSVLPDREFPTKKAPVVMTIKHPIKETPVTPHGTMIEDDGDGAMKKLRRPSMHRMKG